LASNSFVATSSAARLASAKVNWTRSLVIDSILMPSFGGARWSPSLSSEKLATAGSVTPASGRYLSATCELFGSPRSCLMPSTITRRWTGMTVGTFGLTSSGGGATAFGAPVQSSTATRRLASS
jgi:hypothetical protein